MFQVTDDSLNSSNGSISRVEEMCSLRPRILCNLCYQDCCRPGNALEILKASDGCANDIDNSGAENFEIACEYKYDGERCQIHVFGSDEGVSVQLFSRNLENTTDRFPDVVTMIKSGLASGKWKFNNANPSSFIMDCEIVAFDPEINGILPFQTLSKRQRKNVDEHSISIDVLVIAFDLLYIDGISLLEKHTERRSMLDQIFCAIDGKICNISIGNDKFCPLIRVMMTHWYLYLVKW